MSAVNAPLGGFCLKNKWGGVKYGVAVAQTFDSDVCLMDVVW